ncbi:hypothetical protein TNCV_4116691 [Trichonephila clavipes]|nr:hypothetical protein TNCV_4116691 [Trichonephila clavipes]
MVGWTACHLVLCYVVERCHFQGLKDRAWRIFLKIAEAKRLLSTLPTTLTKGIREVYSTAVHAIITGARLT